MNLSEEELVKHVRIQDYGTVHEVIGTETELCKLRYAIWNSAMEMKGREWSCNNYRARMKCKSNEEVLEMIARARLEGEI